MSEAEKKTDPKDPNFIPPLVGSEATKALAAMFYDPPESAETLYRVPALNVAFAVTSAILFAVTVWSIWQDHSRDWKNFNAEWRAAQTDDYRQKMGEEDQRLQKEQLAEKQAEMERLGVALEAMPNFETADAEAARAETVWGLAEIDAKFFKSDLDAERFVFEEKRKHVLDGPLKDTPQGRAELTAIEDAFEKEWVRKYEELLNAAEVKKTTAQDLRMKADDLARTRDDLQKEIAVLTRGRNQLAASLRNVEPSAANVFRNAPLIPPYGPTNVIEKVVLNDLTEPMNFLDVPRVDRCKTCHVNIDSPDSSLAEFTDERMAHGGRLFRSHPRIDLYVGSASPHPYEQFGCTICHYGDGHSTSFEFAAHTPRDEEQKHEWEKKYHWHKLHHQDFPMLPMGSISSTCAKCHPEQDRIEGAGTYNAGRELVEDYGCYACHKIEGFEKFRKVGPNLQRIANKVDGTFLYRWVKDPHGFRPTTKMPNFFDLSNSSGTFNIVSSERKLEPHDFRVRNEVEALSIAAYVQKSSRPRAPAELYQNPVKQGDAARGKDLFFKVGCLGCHSVVREGWIQNDHGPDLSAIGSKLKPDWLADWIVNPQKHDPQSRMPRLRIETEENGPQKLADLIAYLMTLRDPDFEARAVPAVDPAREKVLREIAFDYHRRTETRADAEKWVASRTVPDLLAYVGEKLIGRYGCFGCHLGISDEFDKMAPIGTELSTHGSKEIDRLDFAKWGHQARGEYAIPKTRAGWFAQKLTDPRIYDVIPKEVRRSDGSTGYEATDSILQKTPEELLKMPLFSFRTVADPRDLSDPVQAEKFRLARAERIDQVVTFLLSRVDDKERIPLHKKRRLNAEEQAIEEGRNLIRYLNCQGCHRLGVDPRTLPLRDLPTYSFDVSDEEKVRNHVEGETWLAEDITLGKMTIPAGTFLDTELRDANDPANEDLFSVRMLAHRWWEASKRPERERLLKVLGYQEGRMRRYFGDSAEARPRAAPLLRKEGERVHGDWFFKFLRNVKPLRLQLDLRMPSFPITPEQTAAIVRWFKLTAGAPYPALNLNREEAEVLQPYWRIAKEVPLPPLLDLMAPQSAALKNWGARTGRPLYPHEEFAAHELTPESARLAKLGREMFQVTFPEDPMAKIRLQCNTCHPAGDKKPTVQDQNAWGPDLGLARERLRPDWIERWLLDPASYMPGTKMPNNFYNPSQEYDPNKKDAKFPRPNFREEIQAIVQYLMHMREIDAAAPAR